MADEIELQTVWKELLTVCPFERLPIALERIGACTGQRYTIERTGNIICILDSEHRQIAAVRRRVAAN